MHAAIVTRADWLNASNVRWSWAYLQAQRARLVAEVPECAAEEAVAQELLGYKFDWNYATIFEFLLSMREAAAEAAERAEATALELTGEAVETAETKRQLGLARLGVVRTNTMLRECLKTAACHASLGVDLAELLLEELEEEAVDLSATWALGEVGSSAGGAVGRAAALAAAERHLLETELGLSAAEATAALAGPPQLVSRPPLLVLPVSDGKC